MSHCSVDECSRPTLARGLCQLHYARWHRGSDVGPAKLLRTPGDPNATEKACTSCEVVKPLRDFFNDRRNATGKMSQCKACMGAKIKGSRRLRLYGLPPEQYEEMERAHKGRCGCCGEASPKLVVDHCHRSGKVRALLCDRCNRLLGVADDDLALLKKAIRFLRRHQDATEE
ncbi:endonuclease VII domain-containing protein [Micromonospora tarensis]|uniref:Endonuclease VII domain-containing protein n=1 Tax=Micromonospora tarensis TaxID=2806100 RepID=A0ABS1YD37_9ACTN|nr:endonuclease VII domain-containing protein [Micromonospora tarensis]MBM0275328.1 endonuclease VII domain-containing protein [Micromonospora tarensis]